jgi:uncharacterized protein (UPF0333 family)
MIFAVLLLLCDKGETRAVFINKDNFTQQLTQVERIAETKEITINTGQDFSYIDGSLENGIMIIYETVSSRTKFRTISPIIGIESDSIFIDCSYIRAIDNPSGNISVGAYCRGEPEATRDTIIDAENDQHLIIYSSSAQWLKKVRKIVDCKSPPGLIYSNYYFVRCQNGDKDELTENIETIVLSQNFNLLFSVSGYELAPIKSIKNAKKFVFWGLKKNSTHEIIEMSVPTKE